MTQPLDTPSASRRRIRSFVLRAGRMTAGQERAWRELWPRYGIEYNGARIDFDAVFQRQAPRMVEIGFGTGDALLAYAHRHPESDCLGIEVHRPGIGHFLLETSNAQLRNVRVICHDAVEVLENALADRSVDVVHIYFPDPWHKKRHHKRRLIQPAFVNSLTRVVKHGGLVRLATDWEEYAQQMREIFGANSEFRTVACDSTHALSAITAATDTRPLTRFERRGHRLGHGVWDFAYQRV